MEHLNKLLLHNDFYHHYTLYCTIERNDRLSIELSRTSWRTSSNYIEQKLAEMSINEQYNFITQELLNPLSCLMVPSKNDNFSRQDFINCYLDVFHRDHFYFSIIWEYSNKEIDFIPFLIDYFKNGFTIFHPIDDIFEGFCGSPNPDGFVLVGYLFEYLESNPEEIDGYNKGLMCVSTYFLTHKTKATHFLKNYLEKKLQNKDLIDWMLKELDDLTQ